IGKKWLRFGEWGDDKHTRLFNRIKVKWNNAEVHESLLLPQDAIVFEVGGNVLHKTAGSIAEYEKKMKSYAALNAEKYFKQGRRSGMLKMIFSAVFSFIKNYFFKLGFLDGTTGFQCAKINAGYTFLKYKKLRKLNQQSGTGSLESGKTS
ncbi:MAG TPA: hypothetical protein VJ765_09845, partial [Chitinophagaceae bacterium]|nr:hypothetical protein [Chitinophagaceae bacterium]